MPQPCRKPLNSNPFESYRDPETGQWKVRYPASGLSTLAQSSPHSLPGMMQEAIKPKPNMRLWEKTAQTRVA